MVIIKVNNSVNTGIIENNDKSPNVYGWSILPTRRSVRNWLLSLLLLGPYCSKPTCLGHFEQVCDKWQVADKSTTNFCLFSADTPTPAPQIRRVSRRHCALYKLNLLTYLQLAAYLVAEVDPPRQDTCRSNGSRALLFFKPSLVLW